MAKSLQEIEDHYIRQGLKGEVLRLALEADTDFQKLLEERRSRIKNKFGITEEESKEYLLPNEEDYEILSIVKSLESNDLSEHDREIIELIRAQLREDWRTPLMERLKQLKQKYS